MPRITLKAYLMKFVQPKTSKPYGGHAMKMTPFSTQIHHVFERPIALGIRFKLTQDTRLLCLRIDSSETIVGSQTPTKAGTENFCTGFLTAQGLLIFH